MTAARPSLSTNPASADGAPDQQSDPNQSGSQRLRVVIAGGSGFVGQALAQELKLECTVSVLSRSGTSADPEVRGHSADLFSLLQTERAVNGHDVAVYLVHSMNPTARLTQAHFEDLDLIMADNFARACALAGIKHIVYLGGLIPENTTLSRHLESRLETERALAAHGTPVTAVRAGLILGGAGSSFRILLNVVKRLPVMVVPQWTRSLTQPVALRDAVRTISQLLKSTPGSASSTRVVNIGGPDVLSYQELMRRTAKAMGRTLRILTVPINSYTLSRIWVQLFSGASAALVKPLVESLKDSMLAQPNHLGKSGVDCDTALGQAIQEAHAADSVKRKRKRSQRMTARPPRKRRSRDVRSIQRLPLPRGKTARWASRRYAIWLDKVTGPLLAISFDRRADILSFRVGPILLLELALATNRSSPDRVLFYITDGILLRQSKTADSPGRLEFRSVFDGEFLLAAIHDFRPGLPWAIYNLSQARIHLFVMWSFARHLAGYAARKSTSKKI